MRWTMPWIALVAFVLLAAGASPGHAQALNDVGRLLQDRLLGGQQQQPDQDAQRRAYEQGRRDADREQRQGDFDRRNAGRRDDRGDRRNDDRRYDDRQREDRDYRYDQRQPGRY